MKMQRILFFALLPLMALFLGACPPRSPGKLEMTVAHEKITTRISMIVKGKNYSPNKQVTITIVNFPRKEGTITHSANTDASGSFTWSEDFAFTSVGRDEEFINILLTGRDNTTGLFAIQDVSPEPYLSRL